MHLAYCLVINIVTVNNFKYTITEKIADKEEGIKRIGEIAQKMLDAIENKESFAFGLNAEETVLITRDVLPTCTIGFKITSDIREC